MKIDYIDIDSLQKGDWHATHVLRPDLSVLAKSLGEFGFVSPIIIRKADNSIIDGYHRWMIVKENQDLRAKTPQVPCFVVDCDSIEAAMMHLRLNRGRGNLIAHKVSPIIKKLVRSKKYTDKDLSKLLSMTNDELGLLLDGTIIKRINVAEHKYSRAWVPIEAPKGTVENFVTERPPNSDR